MISFYPGPSRVYHQIPEYVKDAYQKGILSINHRSPEFEEISRKAVHLLKEKLQIPEDYSVFFTSSATECWEIISQSLVRQKSFHLFNGAFGEKWWEYARKLQPGAVGQPFSLEETLKVDDLKIGKDIEIICITQNETSNGTAVGNATIRKVKDNYPNQLIAVDATSSMAGAYLDFGAADVWLSSVQKCFGLPAGMGVMVCSPKAIQRAKEIGETNHYNSLVFMVEKMADYQTTYTPNVLSIYLLMRTLESVSSIQQTDRRLQQQLEGYEKLFSSGKNIKWLVKNPEARSTTVIALEAAPKQVKAIKSAAKEAGILLGNGYGKWKENTFRIANFPAIEPGEIASLKKFFGSSVMNIFNFKEIASVTLILFSVIDILGSIPIVVTLRKKVGSIQSGKATIVSGVIMVGFLFLGDQILRLFGLDVASFSLAGALIMFLLGIEMVLGIEIFKTDPGASKSASIVPLAFPLIAGAGTMTTLISLRAAYALPNILLGIAINLILVYIVLKSSVWLERKLGPSGFNILRKVFGIILISIAIKLFKNQLAQW